MKLKKKWRSKSPIVQHGPYSCDDGVLRDVNGIGLAILHGARYEDTAWDRALVNLLNVAAKRGTAKP